MCVFAHIYISALVNYTATHMWRLKTSHGTFKNSSCFRKYLSSLYSVEGMSVARAHDCTNTHLHGLGPVPTQRTKPEDLEDGPDTVDEQERKRCECNGRFFRWCIVWVNLYWSGLTTCFFPDGHLAMPCMDQVLTKDGWCAYHGSPNYFRARYVSLLMLLSNRIRFMICT